MLDLVGNPKDGLSRIAVQMYLSYLQAFIIALTSDFIPRLVFVYYESNNGTLDGYTDWTLSYFNTSDFEADKMPRPGLGPSVDLCR